TRNGGFGSGAHDWDASSVKTHFTSIDGHESQFPQHGFQCEMPAASLGALTYRHSQRIRGSIARYPINGDFTCTTVTTVAAFSELSSSLRLSWCWCADLECRPTVREADHLVGAAPYRQRRCLRP